MAFGRLRRQADALAGEAARLAQERNAHTRRSIALAGETLASPAGLALCFAVGVVVGAPARASRADREQSAGVETESRVAHWLAGPVAGIALRAASAYLAGSLRPEPAGSSPPRVPA